MDRRGSPGYVRPSSASPIPPGGRRGSRPGSASPGAHSPLRTAAGSGRVASRNRHSPGPGGRRSLAPISSPADGPESVPVEPFVPDPLLRGTRDAVQATEDVRHGAGLIAGRVDAICDDAGEVSVEERMRRAELGTERRRTLDALNAADELRHALVSELSSGVSPPSSSPLPPTSPQPPIPRSSTVASAGLVGRSAPVETPDIPPLPESAAAAAQAPTSPDGRRRYRSLADTALRDVSAARQEGSKGSLSGGASEDGPETQAMKAAQAWGVPTQSELTAVAVGKRPLEDLVQMLEEAKGALLRLPLPSDGRRDSQAGGVSAKRAAILKTLTLCLAAGRRAQSLRDDLSAELWQTEQREVTDRRRYEANKADLRREVTILRSQVEEVRSQLEDERRKRRRPSDAAAPPSPRDRLAQKGRDGSRTVGALSPRDVGHPDGEVTFVFMSVQNSTPLWELNTGMMKTALALHNSEVRRLLVQFGGYEVRSEGDGFKLAFQGAQQAVEFAVAVQLALADARWTPGLLMAAADECGEVFDSAGVRIFKGLRVCCGIHKGSSIIAKDAVSGRMDYFGPNVNVSQRLCELSRGGEILVTSTTMQAIEKGGDGGQQAKERLKNLSCRPLGALCLRGVSQSVELQRVLPQRLSGRHAVFEAAPAEPELPSTPRRVMTPRGLSRSPSPSAASLASTSWADGGRQARGAAEWIAKRQLEIRRQLAAIAQAKRGYEEDMKAARTLLIKPPQGRVAVVFTDVQGGSRLWDAHTDPMMEAIRLHNELFRTHFEVHNCYEVKTEGDCFMLVCGSVVDALRLCVGVQAALVKQTWPAGIMESSACGDVLSQGRVLLRGLRVRMGVHVGEPIAERSPVTARMEYMGPVVNKAAAVCAAAFGGEIMVTEEVEKDLRKAASPTSLGLVVTALQPRVLPGSGSHDPVKVFRVLPADLEGRSDVFSDAERQMLELDAKASAAAPHAPFVRRTLHHHWVQKQEDAEREVKSLAETEKLLFTASDEDAIQPPTGFVTLAFTDVQGSTELWDRRPTEMRQALVLHNAAMRRVMKKHCGYEVKTEGDAFMVAFTEPSAALAWCSEAQTVLVNLDWPDEILKLKNAAVEEHQGVVLWRGLRVRMGFHSGEPFCEPDPTTGRMDYFGPMVNEAARVSGQGRGGEVVATTEAARQALGKAGADSYVLTELGEVQLKGIRRLVSMVRVMPKSLSGRVFGELKKQPKVAMEQWWKASDVAVAKPEADAPPVDDAELSPKPTGKYGPVLEAVSLAFSTLVTEAQMEAKRANEKRAQIQEKAAELRGDEAAVKEAKEGLAADLSSQNRTVQAWKTVTRAAQRALVTDMNPRTGNHAFLCLDHMKLRAVAEEVLCTSDEATLAAESRDKGRQAAVLSRFKLAALNSVRRKVVEDPAALLLAEKKEGESLRSEFNKMHKLLQKFFLMLKQFLGHIDPLMSKELLTEDQFVYQWVKFQRELAAGADEDGQNPDDGRGRRKSHKSHIQEFAEQCEYACDDTPQDWRAVSKSMGAQCNRHYTLVKQMVRRMKVQRTTLQEQARTAENIAQRAEGRRRSKASPSRAPRTAEKSGEDSPPPGDL